MPPELMYMLLRGDTCKQENDSRMILQVLAADEDENGLWLEWGLEQKLIA